MTLKMADEGTSTFPSRPMGTKQAKRLKVDENARAYILRRTAQAASSLSTDVCERNKLLSQQIQCTVDENDVSLFEKAGSRDPALADRYFRLRMQEAVARVEERIALQSIQRQKTQQVAINFPPRRPPVIDLETPAEEDEEEGEEEEEEEEEEGKEGNEYGRESQYYEQYHHGREGEGDGRDVDLNM